MVKWMMPLLIVILGGCESIADLKTDSEPISHEQWNKLVKKHVHESGMVDYKGFRKDSNALKRYLTLLENHHPNKDNWSADERLAYWINAYNAFTVELILNHYPVESIKNVINGPNIPFINSPWDIGFITIEGAEYDLNNIEHDILREKFDEPRIHFAINCASVSCPMLKKEAYTANKIEVQLKEQTKAFINNPAKNKINKDRIVVSKIFKWFTGDFTENGSIPEYIDQYTATDIQKEAEVDYMDYNWGLNDINP